ncbi:MAG: threonine synthase [Deltaproteobacteria bacterium]|nr:MAG: threonine synthase [Deltaproteobacteria bacterium]
MESALDHLECSRCGTRRSHDELVNLCSCGGPLLARYDLSRAARTMTRAAVGERPPTMWRYREILPPGEPVTLGEGMTPLVPAKRLGALLGLADLWVKDEGIQPTGSFKARGQAAAVTRARALGAKTLAIPTAGNAGGALAAYAARAGLACVVAMPADTPAANVLECRALGARVELVDGVITDCGAYIARKAQDHGWFEVSTLKEPYRIEGKKTMGIELVEQLGALPDVVVYPAGGGVGLIGMWKAFDELEKMGWIGRQRPRMVAVQAAGCAPIVRAFERGAEEAEPWERPETIATGLRVPRALGDRLMLEALRESGGTAVAVSDEEILAAARELGRTEGIYAAPEGAATVAAVRRLREAGWLEEDARVVVFNTGSGMKYAEAWRRACSATGP